MARKKHYGGWLLGAGALAALAWWLWRKKKMGHGSTSMPGAGSETKTASKTIIGRGGIFGGGGSSGAWFL